MDFFKKAISALAKSIRAIVKRIKNENIENRQPKVKYVWNAVRDAATCHVCQRLDGTTVYFNSAEDLERMYNNASPFAFFTNIPPVHPRCRCILDRIMF